MGLPRFFEMSIDGRPYPVYSQLLLGVVYTREGIVAMGYFRVP
jgi:hypothetical protein